jgi:catalase
MEKKKLTTASGKPYFEFENSMTVGNRGPILLQDFLLHEDMAHFNRERIPERVVHAKGSGPMILLNIPELKYFRKLASKQKCLSDSVR